ncbi:cyclodeaminase/cyclohydrolase family protein [Nocardiopsis sp. FIRDI 009]|uniref:cyclodeaminase/cyclohydrolase family protein n=1 Tax=Nocardiopsis sp. FIRDI 009 TaxID=714197 RepID=UPI000E2545BE|nr:cyclodeaminase/cyclohydrolase family protein [Nocardiopsis sp. FIRDI 009]
MHSQTIGDFLAELAARTPAPGGGATAAVHAAQAAALLGMVARYSDGARFAEHAEEISDIVRAADRLRTEALRVAEADAEAFSAVADAYALPRSTDDEKAARATAVAAALRAACAAATTARVNIEVHLGGIGDDGARVESSAATRSVDPVVERAEKAPAAVRKELAG